MTKRDVCFYTENYRLVSRVEHWNLSMCVKLTADLDQLVCCYLFELIAPVSLTASDSKQFEKQCVFVCMCERECVCFHRTPRSDTFSLIDLNWHSEVQCVRLRVRVLLSVLVHQKRVMITKRLAFEI